MAKRNRKKRVNCCCTTCANLLLIGEGDHICGEDPTKLVLEEYSPADDYMWCGGKKYIAR